MRSLFRLGAFAATVLVALPGAAPAQRPAPAGATVRSSAEIRVAGRRSAVGNPERRAVIVAGIRQGALVGMLTGALAGVVHTQVARDTGAGGAFIVLGWVGAGIVGGGAIGGVHAARRYDGRRWGSRLTFR